MLLSPRRPPQLLLLLRVVFRMTLDVPMVLFSLWRLAQTCLDCLSGLGAKKEPQALSCAAFLDYTRDNAQATLPHVMQLLWVQVEVSGRLSAKDLVLGAAPRRERCNDSLAVGILCFFSTFPTGTRREQLQHASAIPRLRQLHGRGGRNCVLHNCRCFSAWFLIVLIAGNIHIRTPRSSLRTQLTRTW